MLNKKRQELIIQNLKSISSQVRLMSIEQLVNLPAMPAQEKIKLLSACLHDSEEDVQNAAKVAIGKLGGNSDSGSSSNKVLPSIPARPQVSSSAQIPSSNPFALPSLNAEPVSSAVPLKSPTSTPLSNPSTSVGGFQLPSLSPNTVSKVSASSGVVSKPINNSSLPGMKNVNSHENGIGNVSNSVSDNLSGLSSSTPVTSIQTNTETSIEGIDGPVDPSLPLVQSNTDISFLLQHIKDISTSKPSGYLTRLFELAKSVHEEVALTALQTLYNQKDNRVPSHILKLLENMTYSSQRRFLMLKIVMDTDIQLDSDILENILINEKDVIIKSGLVKVFAKNCNQNGIPLLIKCLNDEDPRVRANTVEVIEAQRISGCEQEIIKLLKDSENRVKVNAAKYLVKIGYQQAFLTLRNMLVSPEVWLRDSVIFALGEIADQPSLVLLRAALKDPNQGIRLSVLKALARINNNMARQILKAATGDPDQVVAQVAMSLFEKIKNTPLRENIPAAGSKVMPANPGATKTVNSPNQPLQNNNINTTHQSPNQILPDSVNIKTQRVGSNNSVSATKQTLSTPPLPNLSEINSSSNPNSAQVSPTLPNIGDGSASSAQNPVKSNQFMPNSPLPNLASTKPPIAGLGTVNPNVSRPTQPIPSQQMRPSVPLSPSGGLPKPSLPSVGNKLPPLRSISSVRTSQPTAQNNTVASGGYNFEKPRSAAIYTKLCSNSIDEQRSGMKDIAFVMGQDQMFLLEKAISLADEGIRIDAVKILSRKRTPEAREMLARLSGDNNETVSSYAKKALMIMK